MEKQILYLLFFLIVASNTSNANEPYRVKKGERPPIDFENIPEEAYEKGVLVIKFHKEFESHLEKNPVSVNKDGFVAFNLEGVDRLNSFHKVHNAYPHFESTALKNGFTQRHRAWGFHLWYMLELDEKADIPSLIREYEGLRHIEIAEPVFKKELIGSHDEKDYMKFELPSAENQKAWVPNDPQFSNQWHYNNTGQQNGIPGADISLTDAWELQKGNAAVIVAIVDGGIDFNHQDLSGNMWEQTGYNFVANSPVIVPHNHGTHVAGTIAAVSNNLIGVAGIAGGAGLNDGVRLMSCQVFTENNSGGFHLAPVYAADNGAAISQNSWGYTFPDFYEQNALDAIDYFNVNGGGEALNGGITIYAAGNSSSSSAYYPGYYSGTFAVAATTNQDAKAYYSNYGSWIDISAPGGETITVTERGVLSTLNNNSYGYYQGTSMACPHVSGVVALMLSSVYGEFSPEDVTDILVNTTDDHYGSNPDFPGQLGSGRLNAFMAVTISELFLSLPGNPSNFQAQAVSDSQINLSWELNEDSNPVILAWSADGNFGIPEQGTFYQVGDIIEGGGIILYSGNSISYEHTALEAATQYFYKLWTVDPEINYSMGRNTNTFTQCGVSELPFSENFSSTDIPYCWSFPQGQANWEMTSSLGQPAPAIQFSWNPSLTNYSYSLESPPLNGNISGDGIALQFDIMLNNHSTSTLEQMKVQVFNGAQWVDVMEFNNSAGDIPWSTHYIDISTQAAGSTFMVRFMAMGEDSYNINHWVIDNFAVYSSSCMPPEGLQVNQVTSSSANLIWQPGNSTNWQLKWGPQGFDPETGGNLIENISQPHYILTELEEASSYSVYVRSFCEAGEVSLWPAGVNFSTLCQTYVLPFSEAFDGNSKDCWSFPQGQGNWSFGSSYPPPSSQSGTPHAAFSWNPQVNQYSFSLTSPLFHAENQYSDVKMDYVLFLNSYNNNNIESMSVEYKLLNSDQWQLLQTYSNEGLGSNNMEYVVENLEIPGVQGQMFQIRFRAHGQSSYSINGWGLDDVNIYQEPSNWYNVRVNLALEGPYSPDQPTLMHTMLRDNDLLPLSQPYGPDLPYYGNANPIWYYTGEEQVENMPENVVDWVLIEFRDAPSPEQAFGNTIISRQAALLLNNGLVTGVNGLLPSFNNSIQHNLYIVVYHRNHLPVMSSEGVTLQNGEYTWDFTQGSQKAWAAEGKSAYQQGQKHLGQGVYGMFGGDGLANGQIQVQDKNNTWEPQSGLYGYYPSDFDMNAQVQTQDINDIWEPNGGMATQIPNNESEKNVESSQTNNK